MYRLVPFSLIFLFVLKTVAQTITVIDATTRQTIPGVAIYSKNPEASTITNAKGQVSLFYFTGADSIYFKHVSYISRIMNRADLKEGSMVVELEETSISLDEVVVSANRWEEQKIEIPYRVVRINMREARFQNPQTSADLLEDGGFAYVQKSQLAGGSPMLRGFATNRVLLVVDGVRMNNAIFRMGNIQNVISLDAGSLENTEILFGPGAVMYGSDAIGGVMDFHTLQPRLSSDSILVLAVNAWGRYSSADREASGHLDFSIGLKKWAFATSLSYSDFGHLQTGSKGNEYFLRPFYQQTLNGRDSMIVNKDPHEQVESGFSQLHMMQRILFKPVKNLDIDYSFHYSTTSDAPRYDRLYLDSDGNHVFDNAEWYYGPQQWMMNRLGIIFDNNNKVFDEFRLTTALQHFEESRHDRKFNNNRLRNQTENVLAGSLNLDFDKRISDKTAIYYGAEAVYNHVGSAADRLHIETHEKTPTNARYPDGSSWQSYGMYASVKQALNPLWTLNTGLRYSYYMVKADFDTTMFPFPFTHAENRSGALNGSIGAVFMPNASWQIYFNGSTGFHAPNVDDIGKVFESEPGAVVVPNPELRPEYAWNGEIGTSKVFGRWIKIDFTAYYTWLDNAFARRDFQYNGQDSILYDGEMSRVQAIQNLSHAYVLGIQAALDVRFGKGFGLNSILNIQHGMEEAEDFTVYPLQHAAPLFGSSHFVYERKNLKVDLYLLYNRKMDFEDLPLSERNDASPYAKDVNGNPFVPGWYTLNFKIAWYVNKNLSVNTGLENITDQLYRTYASGISAPGRNFIVALRVKI